MRLLVLLIICHISSNVLFSQKSILQGKIFDNETGRSLVGAQVLNGNNNGVLSNENGEYKLLLLPGKHQVTYKFIGYESITKLVTIQKGLKTELNISLFRTVNQLDEITVSSGKFEQKLGEVPVSLITIKPSLIENKAISNPEALIEQIPGVQVLENQISIRGGSGFSYGSGSRTLVMIDGMPLLSGDAGDVKWNALPIENLSQMEVIKGASSVLYGSSALNGLINMRTSFPKDKPETKINFSNGYYLNGFGTQKGLTANKTDTVFNRSNQQWWEKPQSYLSGNFLHSRKVKDNFDLVVGGNFFADQGYKMGADEYRFRINTNTRWRSKKINGLTYGINANYNRAKGNLFFLWQNADSVLIPQGGVDTSSTTLSNFLTHRLNVDPYITYINSKGVKHQYKGRVYQTVNTNNTNQGSKAIIYYNDYQFQKKYKNSLTLTSGFVNTNTFVNSVLYGNHNSKNSAVFGQVDKSIKKFSFSGGIRIESYKIDSIGTKSYSKLLADTIPIQPVIRIGATYKLAKASFIRASFGQGYRFPSIAEKHIKTSVGGLNLFPNPNIKAETGWNSEIGMKQGFKLSNFRGYIDLAGFLTEYNNMMEFTFGVYDSIGNPWDIEAMGFPSFSNFGAQSKNVEKGRISGAEISIIGEGKIKGIGVNLLSGYTYINPISINSDSSYLTTFSDTISNTLKYRSKHLAKFDIQLTYKKIALGVSVRYNSFAENIDQTFVDPFIGNLLLPGYTDYRNARRVGDLVLDTRVSYKFSDTHKLSFLINNLLNREYSNRPGNVLPTRTFITQYSIKF